MAEVNAKKDDVLYYSPSVTVVVAVRSWKNGVATWRYLDISDDVASCNVKLNINDESTFSVTLQNAGGKYTDFFHDGDRIQISCTKTGGADEPYTLLTGHIHAADSFQLYGDAVKISGGCPIHMLKKHYWNKNSPSSWGILEQLQTRVQANGDPDLSITDTAIKAILCGIAGWSEDMLEISDVPDPIVEAAYALFMQNKDYITGGKLIIGDVDSVTTSEKASEAEKSAEKKATTSYTAGGDLTVRNAISASLNTV